MNFVDRVRIFILTVMAFLLTTGCSYAVNALHEDTLDFWREEWMAFSEYFVNSYRTDYRTDEWFDDIFEQMLNEELMQVLEFLEDNFIYEFPYRSNHDEIILITEYTSYTSDTDAVIATLTNLTNGTVHVQHVTNFFVVRKYQEL